MSSTAGHHSTPGATPLATPAPPVLPTPVGILSHTGGRSLSLLYTAVFLAAFSLPIIVLRLWTNKTILKKWHTDDSLTVVGTVFAVLQSVVVCFEARLGGGDHIITMTPHSLSILTDMGKWAGVPLYNLTTIFIKASVLAFYLRFSIDRKFRITTYTVIFVVVAYSIVNIVASCVLDCTKKVQCQQLFDIFIACAAINVATDFAILLLPFWILLPMNVRLSRKAGIAFVLMAGGFVFGVSIYRLVITARVQDDQDVTYAWGESVSWSLIEAWSGLICASLPCLKAFFTHYYPNFPLWRVTGVGNTNSGSKQLNNISSTADTESRSHSNA